MEPLLVAAALLIAAWLGILLLLFAVGRRTAARELATLLPNLLFLFRGLFRDPRVPRRSKLVIGVAIAWIVSPIDLVPEFLPVIGPLDDAIVAALVLRHVIRAAGRDVVAEHWRGDPRTLGHILRISGARRGADV